MREPEKMGEGMFERMGRELREIAEKYGFMCWKDQNGNWVMGLREEGFIQQKLLRLKHEEMPSESIVLSGNAQEIMLKHLRDHPCFTQEDAWAFTDDLNGLSGRMAPPVVPVDGKQHGKNTPGITIGELFPVKTLSALPHAADAGKVASWELEQALFHGSEAHLRDILIGFLRNADHIEREPDAVAYLGEMAERLRLDTVRSVNGEKIKEIAKETLCRLNQEKNGSSIEAESKHLAPFALDQEGELYVAEGAIGYYHQRDLEMTR